ncbi:MAG: hypothetical protein AAFY97_09315, partial [Pseudomonadota bacterium]
MKDGIKTATLTIGDTTLDLPIHSPTAGPDVIDIRRLYADGGVYTYDHVWPRRRRMDREIQSRVADRERGC